MVWKVFAENSADNLLWIPLFMTPCFCLVAFRILSLTFDILILMSLCVFVWVHLCASFTWIIFFFRSGKFPAIISSNTFLIPFFLLLELLSCDCSHIWCYPQSHMLPLFFPFVFLSAFLMGWFLLFCLPNQLCVPLCHLGCCCLLFRVFLFQIVWIIYFW